MTPHHRLYYLFWDCTGIPPRTFLQAPFYYCLRRPLWWIRYLVARLMARKSPRQVTDTAANGQSKGEYATVMMEICGLNERWHDRYYDRNRVDWLSSHREIREQLEKLATLIAVRSQKNLRDHLEAEKACERVQHFLNQQIEAHEAKGAGDDD